MFKLLGPSVIMIVIVAEVLFLAVSHTTAVVVYDEEVSASDSIVTVLSCPPGFVSQGNSCACGDWPDRMVVCDNDSLTASIIMGFCMTYDNETGEVRAGACPQGNFRSDLHMFYYPLPRDIHNLTQYMCGPFNSDGLLCGQCKEGFAVSALDYIMTFRCMRCSDSTHLYDWLQFVALTFLQLTIVLVIVVVFSINVASGSANEFIFFGQVTTGYISVFAMQSALRAQDGTAFPRVSMTLIVHEFYDICDLQLLHYVVPSFCLSKHFTLLHMVALQYATAVYPILLLVLICVCIRLHDNNCKPIVCFWKPFHRYFVCLRRSVNIRTSVIDAFASFILLSYTNFLLISHLLLKSSYLYNGDGRKLDTVVMYYDGSTRYFHSDHIPFATVTIAVLVFLAVFPLLLLLYPMSSFQKCLTRCKVNSLSLRIFVETFQGCYKDGTNETRDCRYFAGLYFVLRIVDVLLCFASIQVYLIASVLLYQFTAVVFAFVRPYKKLVNNIIDCITFSVMAVIYTLISFHGLAVFLTGKPLVSLLWAVDILFALPLLYMILYLAFWVLNKKTNCTQKLRRLACFQRLTETPSDTFDATIPYRLLNSA